MKDQELKLRKTRTSDPYPSLAEYFSPELLLLQCWPIKNSPSHSHFLFPFTLTTLVKGVTFLSLIEFESLLLLASVVRSTRTYKCRTLPYLFKTILWLSINSFKQCSIVGAATAALEVVEPFAFESAIGARPHSPSRTSTSSRWSGGPYQRRSHRGACQ